MDVVSKYKHFFIYTFVLLLFTIHSVYNFFFSVLFLCTPHTNVQVGSQCCPRLYYVYGIPNTEKKKNKMKNEKHDVFCPCPCTFYYIFQYNDFLLFSELNEYGAYGPRVHLLFIHLKYSHS